LRLLTCSEPSELEFSSVGRSDDGLADDDGDGASPGRYSSARNDLARASVPVTRNSCAPPLQSEPYCFLWAAELRRKRRV
jgi:hypothetical protein